MRYCCIGIAVALLAGICWTVIDKSWIGAQPNAIKHAVARDIPDAPQTRRLPHRPAIIESELIRGVGAVSFATPVTLTVRYYEIQGTGIAEIADFIAEKSSENAPPAPSRTGIVSTRKLLPLLDSLASSGSALRFIERQTTPVEGRAGVLRHGFVADISQSANADCDVVIARDENGSLSPEVTSLLDSPDYQFLGISFLGISIHTAVEFPDAQRYELRIVVDNTNYQMQNGKPGNSKVAAGLGWLPTRYQLTQNGKPGISRSRVKLQTELRNGESLATWGHSYFRTVTEVQRVPLLGDIPFIGDFFKRYTSKTETRRQLIVAALETAESIDKPSSQESGQ